MFKKLLSKVAGGLIGCFSGIFLGLACAFKKWMASSPTAEDLDIYENGMNASWGNFAHVIALPFYLIGGIFAGLVFGAMVGGTYGCRKGLLTALRSEFFPKADAKQEQDKQEKTPLLAETMTQIPSVITPSAKAPFFPHAPDFGGQVRGVEIKDSEAFKMPNMR